MSAVITTDNPTPHAKVSLLVPFTIAGGLFMEGLDSSIIGTSLPQIAQSLAVSPQALSMAITGYLLSLAVFIPMSGWIADRFGARKVYCTAIVIFTIGSALCGFATNLETMVAMRILQGFGGAMMTPVGRLILARSFPKEELMTAMNYMGIPALVGPMLGPVVGGFLTTYFSWHWIFFINIPIGIVLVCLTLRLIDDIAMPRPPAFDFKGFVIVGCGLACAQLAIESLGRDVVPAWAQVALFVVASLVLLAYWRHAKSRPNPVLDLSLLRIRTFRVSVTWGSLSRVGIGAVPFLLPLLFQIGFGLDALHSGLLTFVTTVGAFMMRVGIPRIVRALGLRTVLMGNAAILGAMLAGIALFHAETPHWIILSYLFIFGFLRSVQFSSLGVMNYADLSQEMMSRGTSIAAVAQRLSMSTGVAIAATLLSLLVGSRTALTASDFAPVFVIIGLTEFVAIWGFRTLAASDGAQISGHRRRGTAGAVKQVAGD
jgi:EmrB/QacA subfamily drug resistance transporter